MVVMDYGDRLRTVIDETGVSIKHLAKLSGVSRVQLHGIIAGSEPRPATRAKIDAALTQIAALLLPDGSSRVHHPGVALLAADTDLCTSHHVTAEELAAVATSYTEVAGRPVVIASKGQALAWLLMMRVE